MKKNKMMRFASLVLVLTLLSTCAISGTFAKYTTSTTASDNARVAYWGWQETTLDFDLFDGVYDDTVDSQADANVNVVAPGTSKTETFNFKYVDNTADNVTAPEVDYTFEIAFVASGNYDALNANKNFTWNLILPGGQKQTFQTVAELETAIESLNKTGSQFYNAGELPDGFDAGDNTIEIGWNWAFDGGNATYTIGEGQSAQTLNQNQYDTYMGNAAALDDVTFTITIIAEQVD